MKVTLLGTGASDGWPNPWCDCASCDWARTHEVRAQTAVLLDDTVMIDCGPDAPRSAARFGVSLSGVRHLLVSHAHPDHLGPEALMWRAWSTAAARPLDVVAPPAALAAARAFLARWLGGEPDADRPPLRFVAAKANTMIQLGAAGDDGQRDPAGQRDQAGTLGCYEVRPVAAVHGDAAIGPAVLLDVTGPDGTRLLYACDTAAPLPDDTLGALAGREFDAVFMEENNGDRPGFGEHLDLASFASLLAELRRRRAVVATTRVVAVHLSHRNPPGDVLARRLELMGAELLPDGAVLDTTLGTVTRLHPVVPVVPVVSARGGDSPTTAVRATRPRRVLVTGGARSGKSAAAERRLAAKPEVVYVATAGPVPDGDPEWAARVEAHRRRRPDGWRTVETTELVPLLRSAGPPLLVDCLSLWLTAHLDDTDLPARTAELVEAWRQTAREVVAVTSEVGSGVVPATELGRSFRDALGQLNAALAAESDEVWHVVAGIPTRLAP